jgi:hypothetical protein
LFVGVTFRRYMIPDFWDGLPLQLQGMLGGAEVVSLLKPNKQAKGHKNGSRMMRNQWRWLRRLVASLLMLRCLLLAACTSTGGGASTSRAPVAHSTQPGQVLVQLFPSPGYLPPPETINGVPIWTLFGDGTLIFQEGDTSTMLRQAQLSPAEVDHLLDTVVNHYQFFASSRDFYGTPLLERGTMLLTVVANGQHKTVALSEVEGTHPDQQTANIFAIQDFLRHQEPTTALPYQPEGVALVAIQARQPTTAIWLDGELSLAQIATLECPLVNSGSDCSGSSARQAAIKAVYGARAHALLAQLAAPTLTSQNGRSYQVILWPLLPDALHPAPDASAQLTIAQGGIVEQWPLNS